MARILIKQFVTNGDRGGAAAVRCKDVVKDLRSKGQGSVRYLSEGGLIFGPIAGLHSCLRTASYLR